MPRLNQAARVLRIREMLDAHPFVTIAELRETFSVTRRTVYNDITALQDAGVPVYSEPGPSGEARWMLLPAAKRQTITATIGQTLSLALAQRALSFLAGTDLHGELQTIIERLSNGLTPRHQTFVDELGQKIGVVHVGPKDYTNKADILDDILSGLLYNQRLELWYRPPGAKTRKHVVEPYSLLLYGEALYLIAFSRTRIARRVFAVDRITRARRLRGEHFDYPKDYSIGEYIDGSFGIVAGDETEVEILFDADEARVVKERRWHPTQTFESAEDGRIRMTMRVGGASEVLFWLFGRCGTAEIVRPEWLRAEAGEALQRGAIRHGGKGRRRR